MSKNHTKHAIRCRISKVLKFLEMFIYIPNIYVQDRNHFNEDTQNLHKFRLKLFTFCQEEKYRYKINSWVTFGIEFLLLFTIFPYFIWSFFDVIYSYVVLSESVVAVNKSSVKTRSNWKLYISCTRLFVIPKVSFTRATMYC